MNQFLPLLSKIMSVCAIVTFYTTTMSQENFISWIGSSQEEYLSGYMSFKHIFDLL